METQLQKNKKKGNKNENTNHINHNQFNCFRDNSEFPVIYQQAW